MSIATLGFVIILLFTLLTGLLALVVISFDAPRSDPSPASYRSVRRVNTETIETVDSTGAVQRWHKTA